MILPRYIDHPDRLTPLYARGLEKLESVARLEEDGTPRLEEDGTPRVTEGT